MHAGSPWWRSGKNTISQAVMCSVDNDGHGGCKFCSFVRIVDVISASTVDKCQYCNILYIVLEVRLFN